MATGMTHGALTRIIRQFSLRGYAFYDRQSGLVARHGRTTKATANASIVRLLEWAAQCPPEDRPYWIYITGGDVANDRPGFDPKDEMAIDRYWSEPALDGWSIASWHRDPWSVRYRRGAVEVVVAMSAVWFGAEHDAFQCDRAYTLLSVMIRHEFDKHATLMGSPGRTGADLLQRSLPEDAEYEPLPEHIREVLTHNFGQGRMEQNALYKPAMGSIPGIWVLDQRWSYAGSLRHLPIGPATYERKAPEWKGYRKACYRIKTRVPDDWEHIGLVPEWSNAEERTVWPHKPGTFIPSAWLTGAELAVVYENGWPVELLESIVYAPEDAPGHDPARTFIDRMVALREWAQINDDGLILAAVRNLVIQMVGYVYRSSQPELRFAPYGAESAAIPREALVVLPVRYGVRYTMPAPLHESTRPLYRPEWAVQVWGASRAKLNKEALSWPAERILWLRHDSIVMDHPPQVEDTGKIGSWRIKDSRIGKCEPPLTEAAYRQLMREAH